MIDTLLGFLADALGVIVWIWDKHSKIITFICYRTENMS